jgi:hypothetical protein
MHPEKMSSIQYQFAVNVRKQTTKGTLKATEHDKYENISGSFCLSLFMDINGNAYFYMLIIIPL